MATIGTYTSSEAIMLKAGVNVGAISEAQMNSVINQAEGAVDVSSKRAFSEAIGSLSPSVVNTLNDVTSSLAGMYLINYDMSGYTSQSRAETMLDVLRDSAARNLALLKDVDRQDL